MQTDLAAQLAMTDQLLQAGRAEEARVALKRLLKTNPKHTDIMLQLGFAYRLLKQWPEAIATLRKACALAPDHLLYAEHLALVLMYSNDGRHMVESIGIFARLLTAFPQSYAMGGNLLVLALRNDMAEAILQAIPAALTHPQPEPVRLHYAAACAIAAYLRDDISACTEYLSTALSLRHLAFDADAKPIPSDLYYMVIYAEFIRDLLAFRTANPALYAATADMQPLHMIGESHCLTPARLVIHSGDRSWRVVPHIIVGAKAYAFTSVPENPWKYALQEQIRATPKQAPLVVGFGEIDCRANEGIMHHYRQTPGYAMEPAIDALCEGYVRLVKLSQLKRTGACFIAGVPAPARATLQDLNQGEEQVFTNMIRYFNSALAREAAQQQLGFIDLYALTLGEDGCARGGLHIDHVHLKPNVVAEALRTVFILIPL